MRQITITIRILKSLVLFLTNKIILGVFQAGKCRIHLCSHLNCGTSQIILFLVAECLMVLVTRIKLRFNVMLVT